VHEYREYQRVMAHWRAVLPAGRMLDIRYEDVVADLERSARLYAAILAPLGYMQGVTTRDYAGFGPKDAPALWLHRDVSAKSGAHVAFVAPDRASVDRFHAAGLKAGAQDNGAPGPRVEYAPNYYAAFLIDPDGNNVEAVCMR
jgi:catechol 2,3-dioxygenase-like lactoylglutathione lyase family enzyme